MFVGKLVIKISVDNLKISDNLKMTDNTIPQTGILKRNAS